ncbi:MAG: Asp-tRNA(Asn)/Glu-tRNA(Gln) amidotransferase subunit GatC [Coriobacteriia bacterium]|nr:Asp-tRNA(Asn)/Glu-tRNA(Gln) amidotransferase subunit GatC [Coriobacteriia bacterium]
MALTESEVRHVALLARLALSDEQVDTLRTELNSILGHIDAIQQLDLAGVEPTAHAIPMVNEVRADEPKPCLTTEMALLNAPQSEAGAFVIPQIVGPGGDEA